MDVLTQYRLKAIEAVRARRQGPGGPLDESSTAPGSATPGAPGQVRSPRAQRQPQGMEEQQRLVAQYRSLTTGELNAEARRVLMSDLLTRKPETNTRLMALNALLDERKAAKPTGDYVDDATLARYRDEIKDWSTAKLLEESHTLRGALASTLGAITQLKPEAFAAAGRAARWAREAAAMGGAVSSFPGTAAGLPFIAPIGLGLALKSVATVFPEAGAALKDAYHRQLAIGLELHQRLKPRNAPSAVDEAAD